MEAAESILERVVAFILQNQLIPRFSTALTLWILSMVKNLCKSHGYGNRLHVL